MLLFRSTSPARCGNILFLHNKKEGSNGPRQCAITPHSRLLPSPFGVSTPKDVFHSELDNNYVCVRV